jgi:hypothetical protein
MEPTMSQIYDFQGRTTTDTGDDYVDNWPGGPSYIGVLLDTLVRSGVRDAPGGPMETLTNQTMHIPAVDADFDAAFIEMMLEELRRRGVFEARCEPSAPRSLAPPGAPPKVRLTPIEAGTLPVPLR